VSLFPIVPQNLVDPTFSANITIGDGSLTANAVAANSSIVIVGNSSVNAALAPTQLTLGNSSANALISGLGMDVGNSTCFVTSNSSGVYLGPGIVIGNTNSGNVLANTSAVQVTDGNTNTVLTASQLWFGNSVVNATINSTVYTGTANNALYLGGIPATSYVQTSQLGTCTSVLTANNSYYIGGLPWQNVVSNAMLQANLSYYLTIAGLPSNAAPLTVNNALYLGGIAASLYALTSQLSANVATMTCNEALYIGTLYYQNVVSNAMLQANLANYASLTANERFTGNLEFSGANITFDGTLVTFDANVSFLGGVFGINSTACNCAVNTFHLGSCSNNKNGYCYLPGGMKYCWGSCNVGNSPFICTHTDPYNDNCYSVHCTPNCQVNVYVTSCNNTQFTIHCYSNGAQNTFVWWHSVGT
jgi:hypothetical protein